MTDYDFVLNITYRRNTDKLDQKGLERTIFKIKKIKISLNNILFINSDNDKITVK